MDWDAMELSALLLCGAAAITDIKSGLIPNWLTFPVLLGAPLAHAWTGGPAALSQTLLSTVVCGFVPYLMFRAGGMGGGDVKLFAAIGALGGTGFGLQVQVAGLSVACLWSFALLAYRGELLATLWKMLRLGVGWLLPSRLRPQVASASAGSVRLGAPIAAAAWLVCAAHAMAGRGAW